MQKSKRLTRQCPECKVKIKSVEYPEFDGISYLMKPLGEPYWVTCGSGAGLWFFKPNPDPQQVKCPKCKKISNEEDWKDELLCCEAVSRAGREFKR